MTTFKDYENIHRMLEETVRRMPDGDAFRWFLSAGQMSVSWSEFYEQVRAAAKSLMASGVRKGDKVNILSYSCYRWVLADLAINAIGAITVGIYQSNLPKECAYIVDHSDGILVFAENEEQLEKLLAIKTQVPNVRKVVLFNGEPPEKNEWVMRFDRFLTLGKEICDEDFQARVSRTKPNDPACIVYTSGTTGVPKGAVLTHDNLTFTAQSVVKSCDIREGDEIFLFLPLAHVFARACVYAAILGGGATTFNRNMQTLAVDLKAARPHWFAAVPRIFEKVQAKILAQVESKGILSRTLFNWAMDVGQEVGGCVLEKKSVPLATRMQYFLASKLVLKKIREAMGGRVRWIGCGAAPLNPMLARFFHAAGILILEGFGMSENTSFTNVNRIDNYRFGWVGPPAVGVEHKVAEDGEVMFRGRNVMKEYYKMPEETAATITHEGWQKSGDLGKIDGKNFLRITGRKKEIIITAGGKNIAPAPVETYLTTSSFINQACVVGDREKYLVALVTLEPDSIKAYADEKKIPYADTGELSKSRAIRELIESEIKEINSNLPSYETIKQFAIVPEFTIQDGLVTPTLKLKRNEVFKKYADTIRGLYT